ncbi:conserved hypothetical protein [Theileria orientalis strain Shintoku]|uniref:Uncharacterized protein n=1 Tax=Theileria orientalis strain Shintoku TaxID=869250 RepID=J4D724_THEOR|nr:conserved hypothetical protein [Theileria orientalis strain Shintoku]PVC50154.1 hypothetical protein MACL_00002488 [Theileria orientalis]BAM39915.1 conserved hypothetical protein [Theileria orientalis strain Shintoku]|eukprot:XP_009690216.1 conserved hypothetical protein [Theileria orientalis strain Shintoku]
MKSDFINGIVKYNCFFKFRPINTLSKSSSVIHPRNFTTAEENTGLDRKDYYKELVEKSEKILQKLTVDEAELLQNKDVVVYTRNRTCGKCNRNVKVSTPEFVEDACADSWRYFHNFSYVPNCPLFGIMKFVKYGKLRTEQKVSISDR